MSVIREESTGLYHGFVSEFLNKCKLGSWGSNSYVNHVVSQSPEGPWKQRGAVIGAWSHNPKVVYSKPDDTYVMYHIGTGKPRAKIKNCNSTSSPSATEDIFYRSVTEGGAFQSSSPFEIHTAKTLSSPWVRYTAPNSSSPSAAPARPPLMTIYSGISNVPSLAPLPDPSSLKGAHLSHTPPPPPPIASNTPPLPLKSGKGGLLLLEDAKHGNGKLLVNFTSFSFNPSRGTLAWDPCSFNGQKGTSPVFDNGHALHSDTSGSRIGGFQLQIAKAQSSGGGGSAATMNPASDVDAVPAIKGVFAGSPCALSYQDPHAVVKGPFSSSSIVYTNR
jgi:hypothetical protein